jgi:excisionase family DNA binding protein
VAQENWGTNAQAREIARVSDQTVRRWGKRKWIRAVRVGPRKILFNLDDVAAMVQPLANLPDDQCAAVAPLVAGSPDPDDEQIAKVRSFIHGIQAEAATT